MPKRCTVHSREPPVSHAPHESFVPTSERPCLTIPMAQPQLPVSLFAGNPAVTTPHVALTSTTPAPGNTPNNTFVMSASPTRNRRSTTEGYKPKLITTVGAKPACLVNASVTYVGKDEIYAFGGFDQFTDEGEFLLSYAPRRKLVAKGNPQSTITSSA